MGPSRGNGEQGRGRQPATARASETSEPKPQGEPGARAHQRRLFIKPRLGREHRAPHFDLCVAQAQTPLRVPRPAGASPTRHPRLAVRPPTRGGPPGHGLCARGASSTHPGPWGRRPVSFPFPPTRRLAASTFQSLRPLSPSPQLLRVLPSWPGPPWSMSPRIPASVLASHTSPHMAVTAGGHTSSERNPAIIFRFVQEKARALTAGTPRGRPPASRRLPSLPRAGPRCVWCDPSLRSSCPPAGTAPRVLPRPRLPSPSPRGLPCPLGRMLRRAHPTLKPPPSHVLYGLPVVAVVQGLSLCSAPSRDRVCLAHDCIQASDCHLATGALGRVAPPVH